MAKKKDSQVEPGDKGAQNGQGEGEGAGGAGEGEGGADGAGSGGGGEGGSGNGEGGGKEGEGTQYVTPTALQGVMDAHKRTTAAAQKQSDDKIEALTKIIEGLTERLAGKQDGDGDGSGEGSGKKVDPEVAELRRRLDQAESNYETEKTSRAAAEQKEEDFRFENTVKSALVAAGCEKPDESFLVIKPLLKKRDDGTPFATVRLDGGLETDMELKQYIEREFSENVLPHTFKGKMRSGSPASGDDGSGGGGGGYDYTWEQVNDPAFYAENLEKVRKAIEAGRVKGMPKQDARVG